MINLAEYDHEDLLGKYTAAAQLQHADVYFDGECLTIEALKAELIQRMTDAEETHCRMGARCPKHDNQVHGQEASELRVEIEKLLEDMHLFPNYILEKIQGILDKVDCRDSLAHEQKNDRHARLEQAEKVSLSVEGLDLLRALRVLTEGTHPATKGLEAKGLLLTHPAGVTLTLLGVQTLEKLDD